MVTHVFASTNKTIEIIFLIDELYQMNTKFTMESQLTLVNELHLSLCSET